MIAGQRDAVSRAVGRQVLRSLVMAVAALLVAVAGTAYVWYFVATRASGKNIQTFPIIAGAIALVFAFVFAVGALRMTLRRRRILAALDGD